MAPARDTFVLPGTYVDPTCPINWEHPLSGGLVGMWRGVANPGWSGGNTFHDLVRGGHTPHDGALVSGVTWNGSRGLRGVSRVIGCTGGAHADMAFPAVASTDDYAFICNLYPTTWTGSFTLSWDDPGRLWSLFFNTSGIVSFNGTMTTFIAVANSLTTGSWWQSIITRVNGFASWYINGNVATTIANSAAAAATTVSFGTTTGTGTNFNGFYGDVAFYSKRGFTAQDTAAYYRSSNAGHPELLNYLGTKDYSFPSATTSFTLSAGKGTFTVTGDAAGLKSARKLASGKGTFALTGDAAGLKAGHKVAAGKGTFTLTGDAAGLKSARKLASGKGTFTLTGDAATLKVARKTAAGVGVFIVSGKVAILTGPGNKTLAAAAGTFTLTGQTAGLKAGRRAVAAAGAFALTGRPATLTGPAPPPTPTITGGASGGGIALQWMERELKKQQRKSRVIDVRGRPARLTVQVHSPAVETLPRRPIPYLYSPVVTAMSRVNVKPVVIRWWEQVQQERRFEGMLTAHLKRQAEEIWLMTRD